MKVKKIFVSTVELELDITGASLLTIEEARKIPNRLRRYNNWWLKSPGSYADFAAYVDTYGFVNSHGDYTRNNLNVVRPTLIISNLESSEFKVGDRFEFGNKEFEIISEDKAFCLTDIGPGAFKIKKDWAEDANNYEESDIKKFIDEWFEKAKAKETEKITNFERIKQMSVEEFAEWLQEEEDKGIKIWCENRYCENDGDCIACFTEWLNDEVKE